MSKEIGNSAKCIENVARENKDFFMVQGADGQPKMSSLAKGAWKTPTPEQMEELKKGNIAYAPMRAILHNDKMLAMDGRVTLADPERAHNAVSKAEAAYTAEHNVRRQAGQSR